MAQMAAVRARRTRRRLEVPSSCREGLCATCETGVVSGIPDHRDSVLSEAQRRSGRSIMVCVSRARSSILELDL